MPLRTLARILKALNSEASPAQLAGAACLGMVMGLTPLWSLHNLLVLLLALVLRVNLSAFLLVFVLTTGIAYLADPLFDALGWALLTAGALEPMWTALYNTTLGRLSDFNNTVVLGSLVVALVLCPLVYAVLVRAVKRYRDHVQSWVKRTHLYQAIRGSRFFEVYSALRG
ncbi:TIGR03546 family protein [Ectothiorhodospiraceae bacterium WFHF3C12]|nr:TIGR03546 family protein [Ectothiorhodospiraceae bacterium WFHF3C12]